MLEFKNKQKQFENYIILLESDKLGENYNVYIGD